MQPNLKNPVTVALCAIYRWLFPGEVIADIEVGPLNLSVLSESELDEFFSLTGRFMREEGMERELAERAAWRRIRRKQFSQARRG